MEEKLKDLKDLNFYFTDNMKQTLFDMMAIQKLLEKKGYHADMTKQEANKVYQFLLRKGYQSSDILYVMRSEYLT